MKLKDNLFKLEYDTNFDDDVLNDFYIPALSSSTSYKRMTGFFRSTALVVAAKGIVKFIDNDGIMQIITSPDFSKDDLELLNKFSDKTVAQEYISEVMLREINEESIQNECVEAFGWMLAHKKLEIRVVLIKNDEGHIVSNNIFHNKIGIMSDGESKLVFSGSINETMSGWTGNIESFDVFCSWMGHDDRIKNKIRNFDSYWELGEGRRNVTMEFPEAVKQRWTSYITNNKEELKLYKNPSKIVKLRPYQNEAIKNWVSNGYQGIFNMATGTGKTLTAINALKQLQRDKQDGLIVVIVVPFQHLIDDPWIKSIKSETLNFEYEPHFVRAFDSSNKWMIEAKKIIELYRFEIINNITFVTTYDTFSSENFINLISPIKGKKVIIADEVHNSGSTFRRVGLLDIYDYRLGLSATPARHLDDEGTNYIQNYFGEEIYEFSLQRAISELNPNTGKTYLAPYYYRPIFISLNDGEIDSYKEYTAKLVKFLNKKKKTPQEVATQTSLLVNRARILKNAEGKIDSLNSLIPELEQKGFMDYCLIYCSDGKDPNHEIKTLNCVIRSLNENGISNRRFTSNENQKERKEILSTFEKGEIRALVAMKCLDEGVDVPATKNAIIMASTGNPREYIQRRGRVLRRSKGKEFATIFDFIVIPRKDSNALNTEIQIFKSELVRFNEFSNFSLNKNDNDEIINEIMKRFSINMEC